MSAPSAKSATPPEASAGPSGETNATTKPSGPVAFIKSHTTVLFRQKTRACRIIATSPRGHPMMCDRPAPRTGIGHLLHAMVEQKEGGVRVIFWRVVGQKAKAPRAAKKTKAAKAKTPKADAAAGGA